MLQKGWELPTAHNASSCLLSWRLVLVPLPLSSCPVFLPSLNRWKKVRGYKRMVINWGWERHDGSKIIPPNPSFMYKEKYHNGKVLALKLFQDFGSWPIGRVVWFPQIPHNRQSCINISYSSCLCNSHCLDDRVWLNAFLIQAGKEQRAVRVFVLYHIEAS